MSSVEPMQWWGQSNLPRQKIRDAFRRHAEALTSKEIAEEIGMSPTRVSLILKWYFGSNELIILEGEPKRYWLRR
jgi:DNA-binding transcriptional regulator GbsR (MarR family)